MPPKKPNQPGKKAEQKQKDKVIEDKTFGLKNKKGNKQQKFIKMVQHQVRNPNQSVTKIDSQKFDDKKKRDNDELNELNKLLKPVTAMPKIDKQVDPKSILCVFYKQGTCGKGDKCKFSHDLDVERKSEKRNMYVDKRDETVDEDNFENWDEDKLKDVINKKHSEKDQNKPKTEIICKYFLQALEESKYGWFWECPNGDACIYRHALPSGFVLKKDKVKLEQINKEDEITLEDLIEKERAALGSNLTKITFESFCAWKKRKLHERQRERAKEEKRKRIELKAGKDAGLSGRELFTFNPDLVTQDDDEADDTKYLVAVDEEQDENEVKAQDVDESMFMNGYDLPGASTSLGIDEDLFNEDIDLPDDDDEEEEEEEEDDDDQDGQGSDVNDDDDAETIRENVNRLHVNTSVN